LNQQKESLPIGLIVGTSVAVVMLIVIVTVVIILYLANRKKQEHHNNTGNAFNDATYPFCSNKFSFSKIRRKQYSTETSTDYVRVDISDLQYGETSLSKEHLITE
jgi:archaellum component FlaF (FlaF/FlaG flagellin family)